MYNKNSQVFTYILQSNDDSRLGDNRTVKVIKTVICNLNKHLIYKFHLIVTTYQKMNITSIPLHRWGN